MKLIIAGSRHIDWEIAYAEIVKSALEINRPSEIVSGCARGVDTAGEKYADFCEIPVIKFPAEWEKYGNRAGPIRNNKMAVYADALLLIWDGKSKGSQHMKNAMKELKKPIYEVIIEEKNEKK